MSEQGDQSGDVVDFKVFRDRQQRRTPAKLMNWRGTGTEGPTDFYEAGGRVIDKQLDMRRALLGSYIINDPERKFGFHIQNGAVSANIDYGFEKVQYRPEEPGVKLTRLKVLKQRSPHVYMFSASRDDEPGHRYMYTMGYFLARDPSASAGLELRILEVTSGSILLPKRQKLLQGDFEDLNEDLVHKAVRWCLEEGYEPLGTVPIRR